MRRLHGLVLDPATAATRPADREQFPDGIMPTVYAGDRLIISPAPDMGWRETEAALTTAASELGFRVKEEESRRPRWTGILERLDLGAKFLDSLDEGQKDVWERRFATLARLDQASIAFEQDGDKSSSPPDAWAILQQARANGLAAHPGSVSLNHVVMATGQGIGDGVGQGIGDGVGQGIGDGVGQGIGDGVGTFGGGPVGRGPVVWAAANPRPQGVRGGPVVVCLDTGLGDHPWFPRGDVDKGEPIDLPDSGVIRDLHVDGQQVGLRFNRLEDPEYSGVTVDTITGRLDRVAGHGTFIAGLVRQRCPEATIVSVPVMWGDGAAREDDILDALAGVYAYHLAAIAKRVPGSPVDVVSMSFGYYHETPGAFDDEAGLIAAVQALADAGVCVVMAAGNRSTDVPFYPAAVAASGGGGLVVSVGAQNPDGATVSAYSNTGTWVSAYRPGTSIVSTMPVTFNGDVRAALRGKRTDYPSRGTVDVDDYTGGFGLWSGTSFAAPMLAGEVAKSTVGSNIANPDERSKLLRKAVAEAVAATKTAPAQDPT